MKRSIIVLVALVVGLFHAVAPARSAGPPAKIDQLAWLTGSYEGPSGTGVLEENWIEATNGSIAALVRMRSGATTSFLELIVIEEEEGSLVLRLQQWNPGFVPRTEKPSTMDLVSIAESKVTFKAREEGGIQVLSYSKPAPEQFVISIETARGSFELPLRSVSR
jgi:hypothetical protein